ncbi:MAG TPA: hypothetical protein PK295_04170 [Candidatus Magasanikbacteria bacterium]|nr:hypothetical protein [Candidatus Magasanikbacteria bacterium]
MQPIVEHTLYIYETILNRLPPLVPRNVKQNLEVEIDRLFRTEDITLHEVEQSMAEHGMIVWPYMRAFEEMVEHHENIMGDKFFMQKASPGLRKKYMLVRNLGGELSHVSRGTLPEHFNHTEKQELNELLVDLKHDIRRYAMQAVLTHDRKTYEEKIEYYGGIIEEINTVLTSLRHLAENQSSDHCDLAQDIQSRIKGIEHSIAMLGPRIEIEEIRQMPAYYEGKREERKVRWGI